MTVQNRKLIIDLLNQDLQGEHGAIIQYLYHAWTLDLPGISSSLEKIAREEMYHFQWLANRISELGGDPSIGRYPVYFEAPSFRELIMLNSRAEEEAIAQYQEHIEQIDDERTIRLLERIISDEKQHIGRFAALAEQVADIHKEPGEDISVEAQAKRDKLVEMFNQGVRHEYSVVLQYLHQAYTAKDRHFGHAMEQSAIVEMKHMGELAEHVAEMGGKPQVERNKVVLADNEVDMLKANIEDEEKATELYSKQMEEIDDPELKELLSTIKYHEEFHRDEFKDFLSDAVKKSEQEKSAQSKSSEKTTKGRFFTVGSLYNEKDKA